MYCSNCGQKLAKSHHFCPNCGRAKAAVAHGHVPGAQTQTVPSVGRRIAVVLYAASYLALLAISITVAFTLYQSLSAPDPAASFVRCHSGTKLSYKTLGIRNPVSDPNHDDLIIDVACRNLGGNTYTNVTRQGQRQSAWQIGLAVFAGGLVLIELVKGLLTYLIKGYWPGLGTLKRQ